MFNRDESNSSDLVLFLDRPETAELKFGYRVTVDWLKDILVNSPKPFRLAITGALGAGKSTLLRNALDELEENEGANVVTAYVDVWKLDKESARRSAVIQIAKRLKLSDETVQAFEKDIYGVVTSVNDEADNKSVVDKNKPILKTILTAIPFAIVLATIIYVVLGKIADSDKPSEATKIFLSLLTAFATATYTIVSNLFVNMFVNIKNTVSRAPLVGPEEFEKCLRLILQDPLVVNKKVVIVFDNIDRAPIERTQEILTGLSAFFDDSEESSERNLIIVVPFARGSAQGLTNKTIQKFFDVVVPLPEIISQDLTEYAEEMISRSIWKEYKKEIAEIITLGPNKTPREIIHCVNELFSLLHLARQMENKSNADGTTEEYLSPGMVTKNVLVYAKIVVCQSIWSDFLKNGVLNFWSIEEMFTPDKYNDVLPDPKRWEEKERVEELQTYLNSTIGLPSNVPYSPEPFFHLKGADELLKIQGGPEIERAFSLRESKTVEKYLDNEEQHERIEGLKAIFNFCIRKFKNSNQRRKNTVVSFLNALFAQKVADESAAKLIADQILLHPDLISEVGVNQISFITPQKDGEISNSSLWKLMDDEYRKKQEQLKQDPKDEKDEEWSVQYLAEILLQPSGIDRAQITKKDFSLRRLNSEKIISALGEMYPGNFSSPEIALDAISSYMKQQFLVSTVDEMVRVESIIRSGLASSSNEIQPSLQTALSNTWNFFGNNLGKAEFSEQSFIGASFVLGAMPNDVRCPADTWQQYLVTNLNSRYADFQRLLPTGKSGILLFLLKLGEKIPIQNLSELFSCFRSAVSSLTVTDLKKLVEYNFGWEWFPKIWSLASAEFRNRLASDSDILEYVLLNCDSKVAETLKLEWANLKANPAFGIVLQKSNSDQGVLRKDWIEIISKNPAHFSGPIRRSCLEAVPLETPRINVDGLIDHELSILDDLSNSEYLVKWLSTHDTAKLEQVVEGRDEYLRKSTPEVWGNIEVCSLSIITENLVKLQNDPCEQIIDKAIQRGVKDGQSAEVSIKTSEMVLKILENGKGLSIIDAVEEAFTKTGKLTEDQKEMLIEKIEDIRSKYKIQKKGFLDKINPFKKEE